jgi:signal transduction histidine kinase
VKLTLKLALALMAAIVLVLAVDGYLRIRRRVSAYERDARRDHVAMGRALAAALAGQWRAFGPERTLELARKLDLRTKRVEVQWVWIGPDRDHLAGMRIHGELADSLKKKKIAYRIVKKGGIRHLSHYVPVFPRGRTVGGVVVTEALSQEKKFIRNTVLRSTLTTGITILVCSLLALGVGFVFVGRPVRTLARKAQQIGSGDFSGRLEFRQRDEIGDLAQEVDLMSQRLEEANERVATETAARLATMAQLRHADRLTTVGKLASGVAHEMGTPLNVISGRAKMIASGEVEGDEIPENARIISEQADRVTRIIRQLLGFARRRPSDKAESRLDEIVKNTVNLLTPVAQKAKVELQMEGLDRPFQLFADADQMQQVVANMVMNGIQAMPEGGTLTVRMAKWRAKPPPEPGGPEREWICVDVKDEGEGISGEDLESIFDPFFTTKGVGQGTGLGLSVSHGIVQEHGGFISVESRKGEGSCFRIHLPVEDRS